MKIKKKPERKETIHGLHFSVVGKKLGPCDHQDTRVIDGFDSCIRGRIDAEVCNQCGKVLGKKVIR